MLETRERHSQVLSRLDPVMSCMCLQFARLYPLSQGDLPVEPKHVDFGPLMPANAVIDNPSRDYTPPRACLDASCFASRLWLK